jgi:hypothetical protein
VHWGEASDLPPKLRPFLWPLRSGSAERCGVLALNLVAAVLATSKRAAARDARSDVYQRPKRFARSFSK